jgi:hypothetical protein
MTLFALILRTDHFSILDVTLLVMVCLPGWRHSPPDRRQEKICRIKALSFLRMAISWVVEGLCFLSVWIIRQDIAWVGWLAKNHAVRRMIMLTRVWMGINPSWDISTHSNL